MTHSLLHWSRTHPNARVLPDADRLPPRRRPPGHGGNVQLAVGATASLRLARHTTYDLSITDAPPRALVRVVLNSEPVPLLLGMSNDNGELEGEIYVPDVVAEGDHVVTVHAVPLLHRIPAMSDETPTETPPGESVVATVPTAVTAAPAPWWSWAPGAAGVLALLAGWLLLRRGRYPTKEMP